MPSCRRIAGVLFALVLLLSICHGEDESCSGGTCPHAAQGQDEADVAAESRRLQVRLAAEQRRRQEAFLNRQTDGAGAGGKAQQQQGGDPEQTSDAEQIVTEESVHERLSLDAAAHLERVLRVDNPPTIESLAKKVFVEFVVPPGAKAGDTGSVAMGHRNVTVTIPPGVKAGDILEVTVPREDLQQRLPWGEEYTRYGPQQAQILEMAKRGDAKAMLSTFLKVFDDHGMQAQVCLMIPDMAGISPMLPASFASLNTSEALTRSIYRHMRSIKVQEHCTRALTTLVAGNRESLDMAVGHGESTGHAAELAVMAIETHPFSAQVVSAALTALRAFTSTAPGAFMVRGSKPTRAICASLQQHGADHEDVVRDGCALLHSLTEDYDPDRDIARDVPGLRESLEALHQASMNRSGAGCSKAIASIWGDDPLGS